VLVFGLNTVVNHSLAYWFLPYNLLLAWVPLGLAYSVVVAQKHWQRAAALVWWLLFLPNAFYVVTDYVHLFRYAPRASYVFDALMIGLFSAVAYLIGLLSLIIVMRSDSMRRYGHPRQLLVVVALLCGVAIYAGRVLRWNSWDVLLNPVSMYTDVWQLLTRPSELLLVFATTGLFGAMITCSYLLASRYVQR